VLAFQAVGARTLESIPFDQLGGTRHQSAARFVYAHRHAVSVVASHDGELTMLGWLEERGDLIAIQQTHASLL
jgi:hypothetical protein